MVSIKIEGLEAARTKLSAIPDKAGAVLVESMNDTLAYGKRFVALTLSERYGVKQALIFKNLRLKNARLTNLNASISIKSGSTVANDPSTFSALLAKYPHSFLAKMPSGHVGVFQRAKGAGRLPIFERYGKSVADMANDKAVLAHIQEALQVKLAESVASKVSAITT